MTLKTSQQSAERERSRLVTPQSLKVMAIVVMHMFVMVIVQISQVGSLTFLPPSPSIGNKLPADIQSVLPRDEEYSYVIQSYQDQETRSFEGAPEFAFSAVI